MDRRSFLRSSAAFLASFIPDPETIDRLLWRPKTMIVAPELPTNGPCEGIIGLNVFNLIFKEAFGREFEAFSEHKELDDVYDPIQKAIVFETAP